MIYDGHAYCIMDPNGDGGFDDPSQFRRHLQVAMAHRLSRPTRFRPAWRKSDRAEADSSTLADLDQGWSPDAARDVGFRPGSRGTVEWSAGSVDYAKQVMPTSSAGMAYPQEHLIAEMDFAGVDRALLHRQLYMGVSNDYIADCVARYPDRLQGLAHVEEWWIRAEPDRAFRKLAHGIEELGLSGLQFLPFHLAMYGQHPDWDHRDLRAFWDLFAGLGVPLFIGYGASGNLADFQREVAKLGRWMERYPDVPVVLTHGFNSDLFRDGAEFRIPDDVLDAAPLDSARFHVQITFPVFVAEQWDYPLPQVRPALEKLVDRVGPDRLLWGSDIPVVLLYLTYRQTLDYIQLYCDFLSAEDMGKLMGGNMARLMGVAEE